MLLEHKISGPMQSGKSAIALGALERLHALGVCVAYVLPTRERAVESARRTAVPCVAWIDAVNSPDKHWRSVAVDDSERCQHLASGVGVLRRILSNALGPTQLILVETIEQPNAD